MDDETVPVEPGGPADRRHKIPPAPQWQGEADVLSSVGEALALVFWRVLRDVWLWSQTPEEERAGLFPSATAELRERWGYALREAPELRRALEGFSALRLAPHLAEPAHVAQSCAEVSAWADGHDLTTTALLFAEAAAYAQPELAARANAAARMCRRTVQKERATAWYHRAYRLAVRSGELGESIRALLGYGALLYGFGNYKQAKRFYLRAARRARRKNRPREAAEACHDLFLMLTEQGHVEEANEHGILAIESYPVRHPRLPYLVHDWCMALIRQAHYSAAVPLLIRVLPLVHRRNEQALLWGTYAWAAAGSGNGDRFHEGERQVLSLTAIHPEFAAGALLHAAQGARAIRDWERAHRLAVLSLAAARERLDAGPESLARALLDQISRREEPSADAPPPQALLSATRHLSAKLQRWKPLDTPPELDPKSPPPGS